MQVATSVDPHSGQAKAGVQLSSVTALHHDQEMIAPAANPRPACDPILDGLQMGDQPGVSVGKGKRVRRRHQKSQGPH